MSKQLYWIDHEDGDWCKPGAIDGDGESLGALVPVERCEHGKIDGHMMWSPEKLYDVWCPGAGLEDDDE